MQLALFKGNMIHKDMVSFLLAEHFVINNPQEFISVRATPPPPCLSQVPAGQGLT